MKFLRYFLVISLLFPAMALALESDKTKPITIVSDSAQIDHKKGVSIYTGHVHVQQGTMNLFADKLVVYNNKDNKLTEVIATGNLAKVRAETKPGQPKMHAQAQTIKYFPIKGKAHLLGKAKVWQGGNVFQGPNIYYNVNTETVYTPKSSQGRTQITIQPQSDLLQQNQKKGSQ